MAKQVRKKDILKKTRVRRTLKEMNALEDERHDFFNMMFHDLKNPITAVVGSIDIVREGRLGPINPEQEEYLQSALDSCGEVVTMIENLLDVQRFEAGRMPISIRPSSPADITASAAKSFMRAIEYDKITLKLDIAENMPRIAVDRAVMGRVLVNLLANAVKFTHEGGTIEVTCHCIENSEECRKRIPESVYQAGTLNLGSTWIRFSIKDNGYGIPIEDLRRIFERYTQSHNAIIREKGGAGLGLAFCKMAIECFNGIIWAESAGENGSEFIILLPCYAG